MRAAGCGGVDSVDVLFVLDSMASQDSQLDRSRISNIPIAGYGYGRIEVQKWVYI